MKKIIVALLAISLVGIYSCSKNDPGIQPPAHFGESSAPWAEIQLGKNAFAVNESLSPTATVKNVGSYSWDFGDGSSPSTSTTPSHTYLAHGIFTIKLTVFSADKSKKYIASVKVVVGTRYFDSAVVIQIPAADSNGNSWTNNLQNPYVGFNLQQTFNGTPMIAVSDMVFVQFDPQKLWDIQYKDKSTAIVITPESWTYGLFYAQDQSLSNVALMHMWMRDMSKETNQPMLLRGSQPGHNYQVKIYWSIGN